MSIHYELWRDAVAYEHTSQPVAGLFTTTVPECQLDPALTALVKNTGGDPIDAQSGAGVVSYDVTKDVVIVDGTQGAAPSFFSAYIQIETANGLRVLRRLEVTLFAVAYSETEIVKEYPYAGTEKILLSDVLSWATPSGVAPTELTVLPAVYVEASTDTFVEYVSEGIVVADGEITVEAAAQAYRELFLLYSHVSGLVLAFKIPLKITECAFTAYETATPIEIDWDVADFRGSEYYTDQQISELFPASITQCRVRRLTLEGSGADIVTYDDSKDQLLVDRTLKSGNYEVDIVAETNSGITARYPVSLKMRVHVGEPPKFVEELESPFLVAVDQLSQLKGESPVLEYASPLITDLEGDAITLAFTVPEALPAVSIAFVEDHFLCTIDTALITEELAGTHEVLIDMLDDGPAPKEASTVAWTLEIEFTAASADASDLSPEEAEALQAELDALAAE